MSDWSQVTQEIESQIRERIHSIMESLIPDMEEIVSDCRSNALSDNGYGGSYGNGLPTNNFEINWMSDTHVYIEETTPGTVWMFYQSDNSDDSGRSRSGGIMKVGKTLNNLVLLLQTGAYDSPLYPLRASPYMEEANYKVNEMVRDAIERGLAM